MNAETSPTAVSLIPFALKDAPALIESVFPAQKISYEAQAERNSLSSQILTRLSSYWKGRKPLILVRAIVLGSLLPKTGDPAQDLEVFEKLMAIDEEGLARRALAKNELSAKDLQKITDANRRERYFSGNGWRRGISDDEKLEVFRVALSTLGSYEEKARKGKRPEEVDQEWLYAPVWGTVNRRYAHWGVNASNIEQLVEQLGILRYGRRPRVGDAFCGGGSIPFEAARIGCDSYASDLNPIACMLTWGAFNVIGAPPDRWEKMERARRAVADAVDKEIERLGVERDSQGNRAKYFIYCLETRCPETGWMIPLSPTWVVSPKHRAVALLTPNEEKKRFDVEIVSGASDKQMKEAEKGTVQGGDMVYSLHGRTHRFPIATLRGDYRDPEGKTANRLRRWEKEEFKPRPDDVFQERLYAIQWIKKDSLGSARPTTYFSTVTEEDLERERQIEGIVADNLLKWQKDGLIPNMEIESGEETERLMRERGWTYWHHLFNARQLLTQAIALQAWKESDASPLGWIVQAKVADYNAKLCRWHKAQCASIGVFYNQAINPLYNYATRSNAAFEGRGFALPNAPLPNVELKVESTPANKISQRCDLWITDPPYADAVNYHEITEYFIAWLRKNPPKPFDEWVWDSRRALAIKGSGEDFRRGMVDAYTAMAEHMPDNGLQCAMFTHQDTGVWSDMVGVFWAAGMQVAAAWYIATETAGALKQGGYVRGTVILLLKKRPKGEKSGYRQLILPEVRAEARRQIETMMHLNDDAKHRHGSPIFNDSDLQMAGYAAALKVLTAYTRIGGENVDEFALRPRRKGETTLVEEIVGQASEVASNLLTPDGLTLDTWSRLSGIERFALRMLDMESKGASKLDNYQNFAKAFRVEDYARLMGSVKPNAARLKRVAEFESRDFLESSEFGKTKLGRLVLAMRQLLGGAEPGAVAAQLQNDMPDFLTARAQLAEMLSFVERRAAEKEVRDCAEILGARLRNMRLK